MQFYHHPDFKKELVKFIKKHCQNDTTSDMILHNMDNLFTSFFERGIQVFPSLQQANHLGGHEVYFHRFIVPGCNLKKQQHPKCYFYKQGDFVSILCAATHIDNYKDSELRDIALRRLSDILEYLEINKVINAV